MKKTKVSLEQLKKSSVSVFEKNQQRNVIGGVDKTKIKGPRKPSN
ncbi:MAG: hypothetical protein AB8F74_03580 [Saprospiraceae bacterium]